MLITILWLPGVKGTAMDTIVAQAQAAFDNPVVYDAALNAALSTLEA
jgi:hypothetical protein